MAMPKGEGAVFYSEARGLWIARITLPRGADGKPRRKETTAKTQRAVLAKLSALKKQLERQGDLHTREMSVDEYLDYWMRVVVTPSRRPKTVASYRSSLKWVSKSIGKKRLPDVRVEHIRLVLTGMRDAGKSSTYMRNVHSVVGAAFANAEAEGRIPRNPVELVAAPRKAVPNLHALTIEEAEGLLEAFGNSDAGTLWATYMLTGARRGEVLGLQWERITSTVGPDAEGRPVTYWWIDLSWQLQRITDGQALPDGFEYQHLTDGLYLTRPKTTAGWRIIPLVDPLYSYLEAHRNRSATNPYGLVFARPGGEPFDPDYISKLWPKIRAASGIHRNVRLHDLRHAAVDMLYAASVDEITIQAIVGHSSRAMSRAYKSKSDTETLRRGMLQLSAKLKG